MKRQVSNQNIRRFLLLKHGLIGKHRFSGKEGVYEFIRQAGCIQYDPVDVCGKSPELVLQARVKGFQKSMLYDLLYKDRRLVDHFDKQLAIFPTEDWKYFHYNRENNYSNRSQEEIEKIKPEILRIIRDKGPVCSADIGFDEKIDWYWAPTKLSRAALEYLYFHGDLVIARKQGTKKYYDLIQNHMDGAVLQAENPFSNHMEYLIWNVYRRIGSVGLLPSRASDAYLGIAELKAGARSQTFGELLQADKIVEIEVPELPYPLYMQSVDLPLLERACSDDKFTPRLEFIAPLDNLIWDRKLLRAIFGFEYTWEIYTPEHKMQYAHYTLPLLYGTSFIGRAEILRDRKNCVLTVKNIWLEKNVRLTKKLETALGSAYKRFAKFNGCTDIEVGTYHPAGDSGKT